MILASAIAYRITKTDKVVILCGARHGDIFKQIEDLGFDPKDGYEELEQGFIDHHGSFLSREEAFEHAKDCGQLCAKIVHERTQSGSRQLISEDLW